MFKKQSPLTLEQIDGKLLSQDRWICFLIVLGMIAILVTAIKIDNINNEASKSQERITSLVDHKSQKNQERKLLVLFHNH
jgi:hypothetical protein